MKKWLFLFLFLFAIPAHAQINPRIYGSGAPSGTCTPPTEYLDTTNHILYICSNGSWANVGGTPNAAGGGSSSPSSLTTFFNKFYGLSPLDTGATGNWQYDNTCVTNSTTTMTCTSGRFVAGDTGKLYEISTCTAGFGATFGNGTLTFVNATTVTLSQAAPFTQASGVCVRWGTNDDTGMQSWKAGINAAGSVHGGYLPIGAFGITKALRFVAPAVTTNPCNSPLTSVASGDTNCGIWITGAGYTVSNIFVATAGRYNWAADGGAVNTAPMYFNGWSGGQLSGFSVDFDASAHDTTGQTGLVAGIMWDNVAHFHVNDIWVQGAHNTTNNLSGYMTTGAGITSAGPGAFESEFNPIIAEINDINLWACNVSSTTCEKETYANSFLSNRTTPM